MEKYRTTGTLVWPVVAPKSLPKSAHTTIVFMGETENFMASPDQILAAVAADEALSGGVENVPITRFDVYGLEEKVWAAVLDPEPLLERRRMIVEALAGLGVPDASSFPTYSPHVTIMPYVHHGQDLPAISSVSLGAPVLWWHGDVLGLPSV